MVDDDTQNVAILVITRILGVLSFVCVSVTALESTAEWRLPSHATIVTQIQALLQIPMGLQALVNIVGTTAVPASSGAWGARGSDMTCTAQGFFLHMSLSSGILLDAYLSLTYLLLVCYGWEEQRIKLLTPFVYTIIGAYTLAGTGYALSQSFYGFVYDVCFLAIPVVCDSADDEDDCTPTPPGLALSRLVVLVVNVIHLVFSLHVLAAVYRRAVAYEAPSHVSRRVAIKGCLYAMVVTSLQLPTAAYVISVLIGRTSHFLNLTAVVVLPLLGFLNFLVFMLHREELHTPAGRVARWTLDRFADGLQPLLACCGCGNSMEEPSPHLVDKESPAFSQHVTFAPEQALHTVIEVAEEVGEEEKEEREASDVDDQEEMRMEEE